MTCGSFPAAIGLGCGSLRIHGVEPGNKSLKKEKFHMTLFQQYVAEITHTLARLPWQETQLVVDILRTAWLTGKQVFILGNGGSAATASHMACDLGKNTAVPGLPRLRVMSLNDNMAHFSAYANDNGYENVFAEQLSNFVNDGDVVIAISTSGNSPNVLCAIERARVCGAITIGLCGYQGGRLSQLVDMPIIVPSDNIEQIEDIHLMLGHMMTASLRQVMREQAIRQSARVSDLPALNVELNPLSY
jgi:D-sedoheptulose 7-phosphate isomerase